MSELTDVRSIKAISTGGPVQGGQGIAFQIEFLDGNHQNCYCRYDQLPSIVGNLKSFGHLAEQLLRGVPRQAVEVATPYTLAGIPRSGHSDDGKTIALQIATAQGFPFQLAMTPELARQTIESLQKELAALAKAPPPDRRN